VDRFPFVIPAEAGIQGNRTDPCHLSVWLWIPACAGMTERLNRAAVKGRPTLALVAGAWRPPRRQMWIA